MEPLKRTLEWESGVNIQNKQIKLSDESDLKRFLSWCQDNKITINPKVRVSKQGSCAQYGLIAVDDIQEGECLLDIPRNILLTPQTSAISDLLEKEKGALKSNSGWVPLLIALMYEYLTPSSNWAPYLHLVPDFSQLNLPMFWSQQELEFHLRGTGVVESVHRDLTNMTAEFSNIVVPFIQKHRDLFRPENYDLELYKKMVAFIMAYSFTEPIDEDEDEDEDVIHGGTQRSGPMMVPMADILNHVTDNNAHLDFGKEALKMTATKYIKKGEEVYNTYGPLTNQELLHMYGFTERYPLNTHDSVEIPLSVVEAVLSQDVTSASKQLLNEKWYHLKSKEVVTEDFMYLLGRDGFITDWEMYETLKVFSMDAATFQEVNQKEEYSDTEGDDAMNFDDLKQLPDTWKMILAKIAKACIKRYPNTLAEEQSTMNSMVWSALPRWQQYCVYLRHGHLTMLHQLLAAVQFGGNT